MTLYIVFFDAILRIKHFSGPYTNTKSRTLRPKQIVENGLRCLFYGIAASIVLRHRYMVINSLNLRHLTLKDTYPPPNNY